MEKNTKRCPRCNYKQPAGMVSCPKCRLNFHKFETATNKEGKSALAVKESDRVLYRHGCPSDVSKIKLLILTIFFGFLGAHYYYVGRYKMGIFFTFFTIVGIVNGVINYIFKSSPNGDLYQIFYILVMIWGIVIMLWIVDIAKVAFNRFKIPVSLPRF